MLCHLKISNWLHRECLFVLNINRLFPIDAIFTGTLDLALRRCWAYLNFSTMMHRICWNARVLHAVITHNARVCVQKCEVTACTHFCPVLTIKWKPSVVTLPFCRLFPHCSSLALRWIFQPKGDKLRRSPRRSLSFKMLAAPCRQRLTSRSNGKRNWRQSSKRRERDNDRWKTRYRYFIPKWTCSSFIPEWTCSSFIHSFLNGQVVHSFLNGQVVHSFLNGHVPVVHSFILKWTGSLFIPNWTACCWNQTFTTQNLRLETCYSKLETRTQNETKIQVWLHSARQRCNMGVYTC